MIDGRAFEQQGGSETCRRMSRYDTMVNSIFDGEGFADRLWASNLFEIARRCLRDAASRGLDGEVYCAVHAVRDLNPLSNAQTVSAREKGEILAQNHFGTPLSWIMVPAFTSDRQCAELLMPTGIVAIHREPRLLCGVALMARALANEPPPLVSDLITIRSA